MSKLLCKKPLRVLSYTSKNVENLKMRYMGACVQKTTVNTYLETLARAKYNGFEPVSDCVKTNFNFRKLLSLCRNDRVCGRVFTCETQFIETNLTFHTVSNGFKNQRPTRKYCYLRFLYSLVSLRLK